MKRSTLKHLFERIGEKTWEVSKYQPTCPPGFACSVLPGVGLEFKEIVSPYTKSDIDEFKLFLDTENPSVEETKAFVDKQVDRFGAIPESDTKTRREFYRYFEDFPEGYESMLSEWELQKVRDARVQN